MAILAFPPLESADENGLVAVGGDLEVESLLVAYRSGVFPWPLDPQLPLTWFSPAQRAVLEFNNFRLSRSLKKELRKAKGEIRIDCRFEQVVRCCAAMDNRTGQRATWITPAVIEAYVELHRAGFCHSVEYWEGGDLLGGLYGVTIGALFAGESMFFRRANASKFCLVFLVNYLQSHGVEWLDCQVMTPFLAALGSSEIPRSTYLEMLRRAVESPCQILSDITGMSFSLDNAFSRRLAEDFGASSG